MLGGAASLFAELTALAVIVAISPFSVIPAILLVVHSAAPRRTGVAFVVGWLAGKAAITAAVVQVPRLFREGESSPPGATAAWVQVVLGIVLIIAGLWGSRMPPRPVAAPRWLTRLKKITPGWAAAVGVALTLVNPKVLFTCAAAGYTIGNAHLPLPGVGAALAYFTLAAGSTAAVPILAYAANAHRVDPLLVRLIGWMQRRSKVLTVATLLIVGVVLLIAGFRHL